MEGECVLFFTCLLSDTLKPVVCEKIYFNSISTRVTYNKQAHQVEYQSERAQAEDAVPAVHNQLTKRDVDSLLPPGWWDGFFTVG